MSSSNDLGQNIYEGDPNIYEDDQNIYEDDVNQLPISKGTKMGTTRKQFLDFFFKQGWLVKIPKINDRIKFKNLKPTDQELKQVVENNVQPNQYKNYLSEVIKFVKPNSQIKSKTSMKFEDWFSKNWINLLSVLLLLTGIGFFITWYVMDGSNFHVYETDKTIEKSEKIWIFLYVAISCFSLGSLVLIYRIITDEDNRIKFIS